MITAHSAPRLNHFDLEALRRIQDAEDRGLPSPDTSVDELFRLCQIGYVTSDPERLVRISRVGRSFLSSH